MKFLLVVQTERTDPEKGKGRGHEVGTEPAVTRVLKTLTSLQSRLVGTMVFVVGPVRLPLRHFRHLNLPLLIPSDVETREL